jgi:predicted nuclease of restriction endonuclease-like RecB superfamily
MLPSELLFSSKRGAQVYPRFLRPEQSIWADRVLDLIREHQHRTRGELQAALRALEGDSPDYRIVRGFAHLALNAAEFTLATGELEPEALRREVFALAAERGGYGETQAREVLEAVAPRYRLDVEPLREALYADLPENHLLTALPDFTPDRLVDRYNLAQAQGLLYSALYLRLTAHRNVPGQYRRLFQQLKFHGLMYAVEGNLDDGYQIYVDGPASLFKQTRKYGLQMAMFLPALLRVSRWELEAVLQRDGLELSYRLDSRSPLKPLTAALPAYDSLLEESFARRWEKLDTPWTLEREVEIVDLKGTVFVPDFALRHPDGRIAHVEIMGFWHPDYLRRKLDKLRRAAMPDLIVAVSERLNVGAEDFRDIPGPAIFFKGKLEPRRVLAALDAAAGAGSD